MRAKRQFPLMGTHIVIDIVADDEAESYCDQAVTLFKMYCDRFSANDSHSELSMLNQSAGCGAVTVHQDLFELISWGKQYSQLAGSFLNIAIGSVTKLWRIGFSDANRPNESAIDQAKELARPDWISLDEQQGKIALKKKGMAIDLGALAKGYIADKVMSFLVEKGVSAALIDIGGNVLVHGASQHRDGLWRIGIQHPLRPRGQHVVHLKINSLSVVTSGIYERRLKLADETYHHLFDSRTGKPVVNDLMSLTIVAKTSLVAETWSTVLFGMPVKEILDTLNQLEGVEGVVLLKTGAIAYSEGMKHYL